jgi:dihydroorotase
MAFPDMTRNNMTELTLRQGTIVTEEGETLADIRIVDGKIAEIGEVSPGGETLDLDGLLVLPGVIDAHVHVREPGATHKEDFRSVSEAALAGGVTGFLDMPNNDPPTIDLEALNEKRRLAAEKCLVNYGFFLGATSTNIEDLNQIENVAGIKVYLGSSTGNLLIDNLQDFARIVAETKKLLVLHAENEQLLRYFDEVKRDTAMHHEIRDNVAAAVSVAESHLLSERFNKRMHIAHLSTKEEINILRLHKTKRMTCEVCPHHLFMSSDYFKEEGNLGKMNPPLREEASVDALWTGIQDGLVDIIATDHAPHTLDEKETDYWAAPCGVPGIETSLPLMLDAALGGRISLQRLQKIMCTRPAEIYGMKGKGRIERGCDADLCIIRREATHRILNENQRTKCAWSPFHGTELKGKVEMTLVGGKVKFREDEIIDDTPAGEIQFECP